MSRKDTILIAVIVNAGLLAILFATAIIYDTDKLIDSTELDSSLLVEAPFSKSDPSLNYVAIAKPTFDEIDQEIQNYVEPVPAVLEEELIEIAEPQIRQENKKNQPETSSFKTSEGREIIVKKGDSLDKIAKANRTTVELIKQLNQLQSERLAIGQSLKIPADNHYQIAEAKPTHQVEAVIKPSIEKKKDLVEPVYHIVKSGDSPWKIAKQYGVNYEQILKMNHLDEEKARSLKIGDRIRVK